MREEQKQIGRFNTYVKTCEIEIKSAFEKQARLLAYISDISDIIKSVKAQQNQQTFKNSEELSF